MLGEDVVMGQSAAVGSIAWHAVAAAEAARTLDVDARDGLSTAEAARRLESYGPNRLTDVPREPRWRGIEFTHPTAR